MDDKLNQAGEHPVSGTDQAQRDGSTEAPTEAASQGENAASAENQAPLSAASTPEAAEADPNPETTAEATPQETAEVPDDAATDDAPNLGGLGAALAAGVAGAAALGIAAAIGVGRNNSDDEHGEATGESATDRADDRSVASPEPAAAGAGGPEITGSETLDTETVDFGAALETASLESAAPAADDTETMTMEQVMAASDEQLARKPIHRGMLTTGTVIMLSQDGLVVDVGQKVEGLVPYNQLFEFETNAEDAAKYFKPGDELQVYAIRVDIPNSTIILSKKRADQERAWNLLQDIFDKKLPVEVEIVEKVRGGLVANLGVRAFLPASQVDVRRINDLSPYVGQRMRVRIIELNRRRNRVIISRRSIMEEELAGQKEETLKKLEPGAKLEGEVVEITDFGAFVNLGGIDGLVHRSEITHGRFNHPREVLEVGQKVQVEVLDMDLERERINLSMKSLKGDPWENVLADFHIGQKVSGKVTNITPFGAFVEIESGLEGLIHVSEMSWTKRVRHPKEIVEEGQEVEAMVLKIDVPQQRISLGLRQTQPDPWSSLPDRYPPGTEITGPITGMTDFGVFMEIEEGIEGLVHISELAHEHIDDISQHFNKGDEITAVILNIDPIEQRASLSRKRTLPYSAGEGDYEGGAPLGAPQSRGGARKGGRRGGRRSQGIDYDYSYASADAGSKTTTKLGDVYADLFAQFGLSDNQAQDDAQDAAASTPAAPAESVPEAAPAQAEAPASETSSAPAQAEPQTEPRREAPKPPKAEEPEVEPENAIDAAEAAALLTAAFRQGKRPAQPAENGATENAAEPEQKETSDA
jgi:small subunit ribosomal protein S1